MEAQAIIATTGRDGRRKERGDNMSENINPLQITADLISANQTVHEAMMQIDADQLYVDGEYNDLTHALEFISFGGVEGYKLAKQLQQNRKRRRNAKNLKEQLQSLHDLMGKHQSFFRDLKKVHAEIEQTIGIQLKRTYKPRTRTDLQEAFAKAKER
jgi:hypothetical protein